MPTGIPGVSRVPGPSRAFLVDGDEGVTLIDTGMPRRHGAIAATLKSIGRSWDEVRAIVLTHSHVDHAGSAARAKRESGAPLFVSAGDAPAVRGDETPPMPPVFERFRLLRPLSRLIPAPEPADVDHLVSEAERGGLPEDLTVIDTPGHTPGHVCYLLDRSGGVLFVGDAAVGSRRGEVKRGFMNASTPTFDASLRHLAEFEFTAALFAHSRPIVTDAAGAFRRFVTSME